jgi:PKD repeat protein
MPTAVLTLTATQGVAPLKVTADAAGSTPAASTTITKYTFAFGEGDPVTVTAGSDATADHTYDTPGTYTVTLAVTDSAGKTADKTLQITVNAPASTATSSGAASGSTASGGSSTAPSDTASALSVSP